MKIEIRAEGFDPWQVLVDYQRAHLSAGQYGATAVFVGTMRDFSQGDAVQGMFLEHYPGMTERYLEKIQQQSLQRWPIDDCLLIHRVGELLPDEPIVLVAVWSAHRSAAFDACRFLMNELKATAPFWKREQLADGTLRWVERNTPDRS